MDPNVVALFAFCASALGDALVVGAARGVFVRAAEALPDGGRALRRLKGLAGDEKSRFCNGIEKELLEIAGKAFSDFEGIRVDRRALRRAKRQIEHIIKRAKPEDYAALAKARTPEAIEQVLRRLPRKCGRGIREADRQWFDELVGAVAREYTILAPWSSAFEPRALDAILSELKAIRHDVSAGLENDRITHSKLDTLSSKFDAATCREQEPNRILFGSRPDVATGDRFVARREQEQLNALIADPTRRRTVLVGMRGCGKTQLAAALAKQCEDANWNLVAWLNAESTQSLARNLAELARLLPVDTSDSPPQDLIVHRCLVKLKSDPPADRLIVLDNVENIEDLRRLVPSGDGLRVIATTTNQVGWEDQGWSIIKVGVFDRNTSIKYLLKVTASRDQNAADTLAERLGDLPLAIAQAAATARNKNLPLRRFLKQLDSQKGRAIDKVPGDEYTDDVATVLWMAVEAAVDSMKNGTQEMAQRQLGALALLAESGVPTRWLDPTIEQLDDDESPDTQRDTDEDAHDALTELIHRSIVQQSADGMTNMLHRLQAQVLRESWNNNELDDARAAATGLLGSVNISRYPRNDTKARRQEALDLVDQLRSIGTQKHSQVLFESPHTSEALFQAFSHASDLGLPYEALTLDVAVDALEGLLGPDHPDTLASRSNLAGAYESAGRLTEAITLYEQVLPDRIRVLGEDHPDTLTSRNNLAYAYESAGRLTEAITLYEQVLPDRIRVLGEDHPDTLTSRNNLAYAYESAGRLTEAITLYEQVLPDRIRVLGEDHPLTKTVRENLKAARAGAGAARGRLTHRGERAGGLTRVARSARSKH